MPALQENASLPAIFSARGHAAADVALRLVLLHHRLDLQIERAVPVRQPLGEVLVDRRFADAEMPRRGADGAWVSMMYTANSQALCSMFSLMCLTPFAVRSEHYMHGGQAKRQKNAADAAVRRKGCCK